MDPKQRIPFTTDAIAAEAKAAALEALTTRRSAPSVATSRHHFIPPSMPLLDARDARRRAGNYRASRRHCADGYCHYFDTLAMEIEREAM